MTAYIDLIQTYMAVPPVNVEGLIREFSIELDKKADLPADVAGQIERLHDGTYKISVNRKDHYYRQRFTMAHELAHYLLHYTLLGNGVNDTKMYRTVPNTALDNPRINHECEVEANKFAASLLMPLENVQQDWDILRDIEEVAKKWQVSKVAMEIRLKEYIRKG